MLSRLIVIPKLKIWPAVFFLMLVLPILSGCNGPKDYGPAASFILHNDQGQPRTLQSFGVGSAEAAGEKYLLINFWASWCKPCIDEIPLLKDYANNHSDQVTVIGIAADRIEPAKVFAHKLEITYPVLFGEHASLGELMRDYGNQSEALPFSVLINPAGQIIWRHTGLLRLRDLQRLPLQAANTEQ